MPGLDAGDAPTELPAVELGWSADVSALRVAASWFCFSRLQYRSQPGREIVQAYRLYAVNAEGRIDQPPSVIEAGNDDEAVAKAKALLNGRDVELWLGDRLVMCLRPPGK